MAVITNWKATAKGNERARAEPTSIPESFMVMAMMVPTIPGPMGFGGTEPPWDTPNPINASSPTAPMARPVGRSPKISPTPAAMTRHRLV